MMGAQDIELMQSYLNSWHDDDVESDATENAITKMSFHISKRHELLLTVKFFACLTGCATLFDLQNHITIPPRISHLYHFQRNHHFGFVYGMRIYDGAIFVFKIFM